MLNYLWAWAGLIIASFGYAVFQDAWDLAVGRFDPGGPVAVVVEGDTATIDLEPFHVEGTATGTVDGEDVVFAGDLPEPLATMATHLNADEPQVKATLDNGAVTFPPVRFTKLAAIQRAAFDMAKTGATLAISLIGLLALWLGLVKIGEASGMINLVVIAVRPFLGFLFPEIPKDHPALGMIALNLAANVLGLGNAATPLGLKAMQELQELNPTDDTATDPMVMLLAMNTASVQLVPPVTLVALMGLEAGRLMPAIIIVTGISLVVAIVAAKLYARLPGFRRSNPGTLVKEVA